MDGIWLEWLSFALRWLHVITAIAWIGASFYFIWLDQSLEEPAPEKAARGLRGELWAIHGGGIYEVGKYRLAPPRMPATLHWFKWEAYSTWLSGFALLLVLYYFRADSYLLGTDTWITTAPQAIIASLAYLLVLLVLYEATLRTPLQAHPAAFALLIMVAVFGASWLAWQLFAPRAAALHVGAALATIMAANVFLGIIPAQKKLVAAIMAGTAPDPVPAELAKLRSTHNNYFTLPVLFCMLASHAPFFYGHAMAWLLLPAFAVTAATARHYFNLRNRGLHQPGWLAAAAIAFVALAASASPVRPARSATSVPPASVVASVVQTHCMPCHATVPAFAGYASAPAGLVFDSPDSLLAVTNGMTKARLATALQTGYMPLGNLTGMPDSDRALLLAWINQAE